MFQKVLIIFLYLVIIFSVALFGYKYFNSRKNISNNNSSVVDINYPEISSSEIKEKATPKVAKEEAITLPEPPSYYQIEVPYTRQAPFSVWDALHEDACEEASFLMVWHYYNKTNFNSKEQADQELNDMISYENSNGYGLSITMKELGEIAKQQYGLNYRIENIENADQIKNLLVNDGPLITGAYGKILPNPYFRNGGPNYHNLVIKGYDQSSFITNDPGTYYGDGFKYKYDDLIKAIHDWDANNMLDGPKNILILSK